MHECAVHAMTTSHSMNSKVICEKCLLPELNAATHAGLPPNRPTQFDLSHDLHLNAGLPVSSLNTEHDKVVEAPLTKLLLLTLTRFLSLKLPFMALMKPLFMKLLKQIKTDKTDKTWMQGGAGGCRGDTG